jgi:pantoate--beta-alanine ligase
MLEIEQKFTQVDFESLRQRLRECNAVGPAAREEVDQYFNAPDRDFAATGEAFRLRRVGERNFFTYKGRKQAGPVKTRVELEPPLPDGPEAAAAHTQLLLHLGYRPVAVVRKVRESYTLTQQGLSFTVCLDEVDGLGQFAEVELIAEEGESAGLAARVQELAALLGLTKPEPRSYLRMLLESRPAVAKEPQIVRTVEELRAAIREARRAGKTVGFVPTMGALHAGHRSLIDASRARDDVVVVSVFVNPTQFGPQEDLERYPRPFHEDMKICRNAGVDLVFHPDPNTIYPPGFQTFVEVTQLQQVLEGASRPGHFRGVATVVLKLLNLVQPDRAYFGQKDAQQVRVLQQMVHDLAVPVDLVVCPTNREPDGLARSSRNVYLDPSQRAEAVVLAQALHVAEALYHNGERDAGKIETAMRETIARSPQAVIDYVALVDAETLTPVSSLQGRVLVAVAVRFGSTRLIDNRLLPQ